MALVSIAPAAILRAPLPYPWHPPSPQYVLAAHSVSQLHAVDGGTTYGLPYDSLMPPVRIEGKATLSCKGVMCALCWWINVCRFGGIPPLRSLSPRGLSELCLRKAEVAADCWRRRNGLPAAAAAAAAAKSGAAVDSGSGGKGASNSSGKGRPAGHGAGEDTGRQADLCRIGGAASTASGDSGSGAAADPHRATLDPRQCPTLAVQAVSCSLALMEISCGAGAGEAGARVSKGCGSGAGASGGTNNRMASPSGNTGVGEGDRETGGGSLDGQGACGGGSGDGTQEAAEHEEAGGSASVGVSGGGRAGQGGGADRGTNSGGCDSAVEEDYGSDSGSCHKHHFAWLANGGPLARRWWRAAVAAVHCALDELEAVGSIVAASFVDQVLDPSLAMPETDTGGTQHPRKSPMHPLNLHCVRSECYRYMGWNMEGMMGGPRHACHLRHAVCCSGMAIPVLRRRTVRGYVSGAGDHPKPCTAWCSVVRGGTNIKIIKKGPSWLWVEAHC